MALQTYLDQTRRLIRDKQGLFVPDDDLIPYINEARTQTALQTGAIRRLITGQTPFGADSTPINAIPGAFTPNQATNTLFQTIPGVERYPYQSFGNAYLQASYAGVSSIVDVITVSVSWGGAWRPSLGWLPWEDFQAYCRVFQFQQTSYPTVFSIMNDGETGEVWLFPVPQTTCEMEWDCFTVPKALWSDSDYEALPPPFRRMVQYYAASKVFEASGRLGQGQRMMSRYETSLVASRGSVDRGKIPDRYESII